MAGEEDKPSRQRAIDSLTTRHIERSADVLLRTLTTAHIEQKLGAIPTESQGKSGDTPSGSGPAQQQQPGSGDKSNP